MPRGEHHAKRRLFGLLVLLSLLVLTQSLALAEEFHQHQASEHCCQICHAGPQAALASPTALGLTPALTPVSGLRLESVAAPRQVSISRAASRAPPAVFHS